MAEVLTMPRMSDTMEEGNIVGWLKNVGDAVEPGDVLAEVETDKATMELESPYEGVLLYIGIKEGTVPIDGVLAVIGEEGEDFKAALKEAENSAPAKEEVQSESKSNDTKPEPVKVEPVVKKEVPVEAAPVAKVSKASKADSTQEKIKASPLAKSMAEKAGLSLAGVSGSGDGGRIIKRDIEAALSSGLGGGVAIAPTGPEYEDVAISQMRKTIARRLGESKFDAPHFYLTSEINMKNMVEARKQINEESPVRISFNDLVVKACALALRKHPAVNSSWLGDKIRFNNRINIGVAVAVQDGLLVPVIRNADFKSLAQIKTEIKDLAGKAKEKKLSLDEMQGNTFTISNLGMFDVDEFTAIINPPDACILAVGSIVEKPIVEEGNIVVGHMMKVTLSCDHRVVDGASGAAFLQTVKGILENPIKLFI